MSGSGRKSHYRKSVTESFLNEDRVPEEHEEIVTVLGNRGNSLFEVQSESGGKILASLPKKFNKLIWIKTGDYVIVEGGDMGGSSGASGCTINHILNKANIKYLKAQGLWPSSFSEESKSDNTVGSIAAFQNFDMPDDDADVDDEECCEEDEPKLDKMGNTIET
mmetsp:Transcript_33145/g.55757  ORF Transcript_33145/g.55757 Transcript_33145/m.55757 type:complete len:164 (-) Transcript_33145:1467-1958(-)